MTRAAEWRLGLFVAAALAMTLSLKAGGIGQLYAPDEARIVRDLTRSLQTQGYRVEKRGRTQWASLLVTAHKGNCTVQLRNAALRGQDWEATSRIKMRAGTVRYLYRGTYSDAYPRYRSEIAWRVQRELGRVGLSIPIRPPIAVAAKPGCAPDPAALDGVRMHLQVR